MSFSPFLGTRSRGAGGGGFPKGLVHITLIQIAIINNCLHCIGALCFLLFSTMGPSYAGDQILR